MFWTAAVSLSNVPDSVMEQRHPWKSDDGFQTGGDVRGAEVLYKQGGPGNQGEWLIIMRSNAELGMSSVTSGVWVAFCENSGCTYWSLSKNLGRSIAISPTQIVLFITGF
jgi:hypothetical protein